MVEISLSVKTMEGLDAQDPQMIIDVIELDPVQRAVARQIVRNFTGSTVIQLDDPEDSPQWQVRVSLTRFDPGPSFMFQPALSPNFSHTFLAARIPDEWTPQFTPLGGLNPSRFRPLTKVIAFSNNVDLKNGPEIGDLNTHYDSVAGNAQVLAKTALLNLYAVLTDEQDPIGKVSWFSYVRKIVRLDQERFIAEVDPALFENVQTIVNELAVTYRAQGYFTEPLADLPLHVPNIPPSYDPSTNLVQMITVKKDYEQGNVQLTLSFLRVDGFAVHLLDCDMDENRNIILHSFDLISHLFDGGTNPISMHEYIVEDSAQQSADEIAQIDLGYELV